MRLDVLENGQRRRARIALKVMGLVARTEPDDVIKTSLYRPDLFGRAWIALLREVLRGPSSWSAGERELFGAYTSRLNACPYCASVHSELARLELGHVVTSEMLDEIDSAGLDERLTSMLHLIEKSVRSPAELGPGDIDRVRAAGVDDDAIADALVVSFVFNVVNRLANTLEYQWASEDDVVKAAHMLHRVSYSMPSLLFAT